jgi:MYXO-CTERM domain-containing protein
LGIRALGVLGTAAILATASTSWGQDAQGDVQGGAPDAATVSDSSLVSDAALVFDVALPGDGGAAAGDGAQSDVDGGTEDDSSSADSGGSDGDLLSFSDFDSSSGIDEGLLVPPNPAGAPGAATDQVPTGGASAPSVTENGPTTPDDGSAGDGAGVPAWGGAAPAAQEIQTPNNRDLPAIGCGDCSTGQTDASGALTLVLSAIAAAWRRRRRDRGPGTKGRVTH